MRMPDVLSRLVDHGGDGKTSDARIGQDQCQISGILGRCPKPAQPGIGVHARRYHKGQPGTGRRISCRRHGGPARRQ